MRIIKGLSALIALAVITVGIPAFLIATTGNPVPGLVEIPEVLTRPDYGGEVLFGTIFPMLAWLGWAWLSIGILIEMVAAIAKIRIRRIGMFSPSQGLGSVLIGAVVAMGGAIGVIAPANAAPATSEVVQSQSALTPAAQDSSTVHTAKAETTIGAKTVTVKPGDSLWNLAERHLGDGAKFKQIAELNYGKNQPGGGQLTHTHTLQPGWELALPDHATLTPQTHTVAAGETLSEIAKAHLGDAEAYPHLLALNPTITDPNQISEGQVLRLPAQAQPVVKKTATPKHATTPSPNTAEEPASKADTRATTTALSSAASAASDLAGSARAAADDAATAAEPAPAPDNADHDKDQNGVDESSSTTLRTIGGIGGILAAGLLALFARRRFNRRRHRQPGTPTPTTSAQAENVEARLKDVETVLTAADIDRVLRYLATWSQQHHQPLPELFCVRAAEDESTLNLYLAEPADLPTPFTKVTDDNTVWAINPAELPATTNTASAAYPALVTVGHDENNGQILLDLEHLTTLNITGPHDRATATMNALAVELGVSPWAEDLTVSLVGFLEDLPAALGTGRIRHYPDLDALMTNLRPLATGIEADLTATGATSPRTARVATEEAEAWPPEIVLISEPGAEDTLTELYELANHTPRLGIATVTRDGSEGEWSLDLTDTSGTLNPVNMPLNPQTLSDDESAGIIETLHANTATTEPASSEAEPVEEPAELTLLTPDAEHTPDDDVTEDVGNAQGTTVEDCRRHDHDYDHEHEEAEPEEARVHTTDPTIDEPEGADPRDQRVTEVETEPEVEGLVGPEPDPESKDGESVVAAHDQDQYVEGVSSVAEPDNTDTAEAAAEEPTAVEPSTDVPAKRVICEPEPVVEAEQAIDSEAAAPSPFVDEAEIAEEIASVVERGPIIRLLGAVDVQGATGELPISKSSGKPSAVTAERLVSLLAYLALHPGANTEQVHHAFWPNKDPNGETPKASRNKLTNQARKYLGNDSEGLAYFPHFASAGYVLDDRVKTDWDHFQALTGPDPSKTSTPRLIGALRLVRGAPFEGVMTRNYLWNEHDRDTITNHISDTAAIVMQRALAAEDTVAAALAAKVGAMVDPANEESWRNQMRAEALTGNRRGVEEIYQQLVEYLDSFDDDYTPEPETEDLYQELTHGHRVAS